ncbi:2684_t:CDS:2, partial [Paraglomus occultum]
PFRPRLLSELLDLPYNAAEMEYLRKYCKKENLLGTKDFLVMFDLHHGRLAEAIKLHEKMVSDTSIPRIPKLFAKRSRLVSEIKDRLPPSVLTDIEKELAMAEREECRNEEELQCTYTEDYFYLPASSSSIGTPLQTSPRLPRNLPFSLHSETQERQKTPCPSPSATITQESRSVTQTPVTPSRKRRGRRWDVRIAHDYNSTAVQRLNNQNISSNGPSLGSKLPRSKRKKRGIRQGPKISTSHVINPDAIDIELTDEEEDGKTPNTIITSSNDQTAVQPLNNQNNSSNDSSTDQPITNKSNSSNDQTAVQPLNNQNNSSNDSATDQPITNQSNSSNEPPPKDEITGSTRETLVVGQGPGTIDIELANNIDISELFDDFYDRDCEMGLTNCDTPRPDNDAQKFEVLCQSNLLDALMSQ